MNFLVTGGTGFVGSFLVNDLLSKNHAVTVLTRRAGTGRAETGLSYLSSSPERREDLVRACERADSVVNLAGEPIAAKRWTRFQKELIIQSRIRATALIVESIAKAKKRPESLISASAVGFYGNRGNEELDERSFAGLGFLSDTCRRWEEEALKAERLGVRVVILRIGIVLGSGGGALQKMVPPFRFFMGGPIGSGAQWMSWIHLKDMVRLVEWAAEQRSLRGVCNATSPHPVRMREFANALGRAMRRPALLPVPGFVLSLALGEMAGMLLSGQKVMPRKALASGFRFDFETLDPALNNLLAEPHA